MSSLLYEIYHDCYDITPRENKKQRELNKQLSVEWEKVRRALGEEFLDRLFELEAEQDDWRSFHYYQKGFQLGVRLMLEALTSATG